ncbi:DUF4097 family beta strand repeat-containing protein [Streptomyces sp. QL37]|uniref:DUF4097 family beta strand repeat-containing protein n=1 Tax=Streptomyces sp. QL37 TaxID=2093747 RepID=UPI0035C024EF
MQKFDTPTTVSALVDIPAGRIRIIAADRNDTTVEVLAADTTRSRDLKAAERTTVDYSDGILRIEAPPAKNSVLGSSGSLEVTIQLPTGSHIEARTAAADIRGVGRLGDVTFDGAQGTVKLDETASAHLTLLDGDITLGRLGGPAQISTHKGDINITEALHGTVEVRTQQGEITVGAARGVSASLDAGTTYGRILNTLRNTDGATAGLAIHATTAYGDITARSV